MSLLFLCTLLLVVRSSVQDLPPQTGTLVYAVHCGLWKIYDGGLLNKTDFDSYTSKVTGIKYYSDDRFCVPEEENYDCYCRTSCCTTKR